MSYFKEQKCQFCQQPAFFACSRCQKAKYCSKQHQIEHWKKQHKFKCQQKSKQISEQLSELLKKRFSVRRQFYENYSSKSYNLCVLDAKVLTDFEKQIKQKTKDQLDEYQYGAAVCLLCRSYILIKDKSTARKIMKKYLYEKQQFLTSFNNLPSINGEINELHRQLYHRKMNLLSTIANLSYAVQINCIKYYVLYTKNIEKVFGETSFETSNCYFLLGCYFAEEGFLKKAIACFMKSAECRGQFSGDCYLNIGILYTYQFKFNKALQMFQIAFVLRIKQYGEDTKQIAEVLQNMGMIYVQLNDFITAMQEYEKAFKIRAANPHSAEYFNVKDLIQDLYDKLTYFIASQHAELKKPSIFLHLKTQIQDVDVYWTDYEDKRQKILIEKQQKTIVAQGAKKTKRQDGSKKESGNAVSEGASGGGNNNIIIISTELMNSMNPTQLFMLSELQLQLAQCNSVFSAVFTVQKSLFLKKLEPKNLKKLQQQNQVLFQLIRVQNNKMNSTEKSKEK